MKRVAIPVGALLLGVAVVRGRGQGPFAERPSGPRVGATETLERLYTRPTLPTRAVLDRLNLDMAWRAYVPTESRRDGFFTIQPLDADIIVQTRAGLVVSLDARDGSTRWRAAVGDPYRVTHPVSYNGDNIFVLRGVTVTALDRQTGRTRWVHVLSETPTAPPAADEERLYICQGAGRLSVYELPRLRTEPATVPPPRVTAPVGVSSVAAAGPQPPGGLEPRTAPAGPPVEAPQPSAPTLGLRLLFEYSAGARLVQTPLLTKDVVVAAAQDGLVTGVIQDRRLEHYRYRLDSPPSAPMAQHGNTAYVPTQDFDVFALDLAAGQLLWRFTGNALILRRPQVIDNDVYITADWAGLARLSRQTGELVWRHRDAYYFLSANRKFVYALDRNGRLLILDRARGTALGGMDTREFVFPVSNEMTDRLYLAANNGLLICLHDQDYPTPLVMKRSADQQPGPGRAAPAPRSGGTERKIPAPAEVPEKGPGRPRDGAKPSDR